MAAPISWAEAVPSSRVANIRDNNNFNIRSGAPFQDGPAPGMAQHQGSQRERAQPVGPAGKVAQAIARGAVQYQQQSAGQTDQQQGFDDAPVVRKKGLRLLRSRLRWESQNAPNSKGNRVSERAMCRNRFQRASDQSGVSGSHSSRPEKNIR